MSHAQTPPSSSEKGSGVKSPNSCASSINKYCRSTRVMKFFVQYISSTLTITRLCKPKDSGLWQLVSSQTPPTSEKVWWHPADTSGFINIDYFLERNITLPITLQKIQSVVQHWKFLASSARHSYSLSCKLVNYKYSKLWIFNEAQGISQM